MDVSKVGTSMLQGKKGRGTPGTLSPRLSAILSPDNLPPNDSTEEFIDMDLESYVRSVEGKRAISRVLIANNGIAAVKAIRSIRKWSYETFGMDDVIQFVAMATPEDIKANATYIHLADEFIAVPGGPNNNNYANINLIVDIAERCGAHAVWAGWGHASENPKLPDSLLASKGKITWIGPPSEAMRALGDKIGSTLIAQSAGVSCMPWSGSGLEVDYAKHGIPDDLYRKSCVTTVEECVEAAEKVGFPLMIKASEGGGGKGIRKVTRKEDISIAFGQVQGEVPGSPVFLMRMATDTRHLEVQLLADEYGDAIAVFGRDCSIQRRHQKIIEEGPVVACGPTMWREMEKAAVRLAKEVGYVGAGTVEYLYTSNNEYYFLELNPRLQVEHPVTELISGVNLPAAQLQVAMGIPLNRIRGVRKMYGKTPLSKSPIDFENEIAKPLPGHVIACRITAENPDVGFQPTSGSIQELNFRSTPDVWGYFSVASKGGVHEYSDSQFGHMFACGKTREAARRCMALALKELSIRGDIRTTVEYLRMILETDDFRKNDINTTWLEATMERGLESQKPDPHLAVILGALFQGHASSTSSQNEYMSCLDNGHLPSKKLHDELFFCKCELIYENIKYNFNVTKSGPNSFDVSINEWTVSASVMALSDDGILVLLDGRKHVVYGQSTAAGLRLVVDSQTVIFTNEYDPASLKASMQGKLVNYLAKSGTHLEKNCPYAEVEVMKMYITLFTPEAGTFMAVMPAGSILEAGDLIGTLVLDNPDMVKSAVVFEGKFSPMKGPNPIGDNVNAQLHESLTKISMLLDGYQLGPGISEKHLNNVMSCLRHPELPLTQFTEALSNLAGRIPESLMTEFTKITDGYAKQLSSHRFYWEKTDEFPVIDLEYALDNALYSFNETERETVQATLEASGLLSLLDRYSDGNHSGAVLVVSDMLKRYIDIENYFSGKNPEKVIKELRKAKKDDLVTVACIARAHHQIKARNKLIVDVLDIVESSMSPLLDQFEPLVSELSRLKGNHYSPVVLRARQMLMRHEVPSASKRRIAIMTILNSVTKATGPRKVERLEPLIDQSQPIEDIIFSFFSNRKQSVQQTAMEVYIRRLCRVHNITSLDVKSEDGMLVGEWSFTESNQGGSNMSSSSLNLVNLVENKHDVGLEKRGSGGFGSPRGRGNLVRQPSGDPSLVKNQQVNRAGNIISFRDYDALKKGMGAVIDRIVASSSNTTQNVLYLVFNWMTALPADETLAQYCHALLKAHEGNLVKSNITRVTFLVVTGGDKEGYPLYFTFRSTDQFNEDITVRHMEPFYAMYMELTRMKNFKLTFVPTPNRMVYLFAGTPFSAPREFRRAGYEGCRMFCRVLVRKLDSATLYGYGDEMELNANSHPETELALVEAMNSLEVGIAGNFKKWRYNNIFINVLVTAEVGVSHITNVIHTLSRRYADQLRRLQVDQCEFVLPLRDPTTGSTQLFRFYVCNPTKYSLQVQPFIEVTDKDGNKFLEVWDEDDDEKGAPSPASSVEEDGARYWDNKPSLVPYPVALPLQTQRAVAHIVGTVYVYDFLLLISNAVKKQWKQAGREDLPATFMSSVELAIDPNNRDQLQEVKRPHGNNDVGMVAWVVTLHTPHYPHGREVVIIANDISHQMGTFGTEEDRLFGLASAYAREHLLPRLYFTVNSGARIGMADEVKPKFKIAWKEDDVTNGYEYLYLDEADYKELQKSVKATRTTTMVKGKEEVRYVLDDIIGEKHGLGVENLSGSGMIAGETSKAYDEIFTLTYVTGRTVGIGSYLARLGQRVVQKVGHPIVLTGYNALNKLLGKSVYTSNTQLGGIDIMYNNGITHWTVPTDFEGVEACLKWLSYVPEKRFKLPTIPKDLTDPVDREITFTPPSSPYDPRCLLQGRKVEGGVESGFFDDGSFVELMGGWARSVVVGRGRLGGLPAGSICVETRTTEFVTPADPACPDSKENVQQKAGQVWFPDSAYKTAQAIKDMMAEDIPLFIFANWRGFSGGMSDMFHEILKFGSMIVDALREYKQPVFVYIPPLGTLRGGAWVVVDSTINPQHMEMYADSKARGGVLEPEGTVDVKFKKPAILDLMYRLDETLVGLKEELGKAEAHAKQLEQENKRNSGSAAVVVTPSRAGRRGKKEKKEKAKTKAKAKSSDKPSQEEDLAAATATIKELKDKMTTRERMLLPLYHTVATKFADLHDTPGRMTAKGVIKEVVEWKQARSHFYWRLRRRLVELDFTKRIQTTDPNMTWQDALLSLHAMVDKDLTPTYSAKVVRDDRLLIDWVGSHNELIETNLEALRQKQTTTQVVDLYNDNPDRFLRSVMSLLQTMEPSTRAQLQQALSQPPSQQPVVHQEPVKALNQNQSQKAKKRSSKKKKKQQS